VSKGLNYGRKAFSGEDYSTGAIKRAIHGLECYA